MNSRHILIAGAVAATVLSASADLFDRQGGYKVGERLTLRPYVSLSYTWDSNVDSSHKSRSGSTWCVNPGIGAEYIGDNWAITGGAFYRYHAYNRYSSQLNTSSYGENLTFRWADSAPDEKGWTVMASENFTQQSQDDDMTTREGRGYGRDSKTMQAAGAVERRINGRLHAAVSAQYYLLDYDNDVDRYASLYGWKRTTAAFEAGYMLSHWADLIVSGQYQWFQQDNVPNTLAGYSDESTGWTVMGGFGSRATERITYRLMAGWSQFEYGEGDFYKSSGVTYEASANYKISDTWNTMLLAASYYQPSEYGQCSSYRTDCVSWGLSHSMIRSKLTGTFDISYRRQTHEYSMAGWNYDDDIITSRLGLSYRVNRFASIYGTLEYQVDMCSGRGEADAYDYDRFRATIGLRLAY